MQKEVNDRTCITVRGDIIDYPDDKITPTNDLTTVKCLINSTLSTLNEKFLVVYIKDFYLNTKLDRFKYMRLKLEIFPQDIIKR